MHVRVRPVGPGEADPDERLVVRHRQRLRCLERALPGGHGPGRPTLRFVQPAAQQQLPGPPDREAPSVATHRRQAPSDHRLDRTGVARRARPHLVELVEQDVDGARVAFEDGEDGGRGCCAAPDRVERGLSGALRLSDPGPGGRKDASHDDVARLFGMLPQDVDSAVQVTQRLAGAPHRQQALGHAVQPPGDVLRVPVVGRQLTQPSKALVGGLEPRGEEIGQGEGRQAVLLDWRVARRPRALERPLAEAGPVLPPSASRRCHGSGEVEIGLHVHVPQPVCDAAGAPEVPPGQAGQPVDADHEAGDPQGPGELARRPAPLGQVEREQAEGDHPQRRTVVVGLVRHDLRGQRALDERVPTRRWGPDQPLGQHEMGELDRQLAQQREQAGERRALDADPVEIEGLLGAKGGPREVSGVVAGLGDQALPARDPRPAEGVAELAGMRRPELDGPLQEGGRLRECPRDEGLLAGALQVPAGA